MTTGMPTKHYRRENLQVFDDPIATMRMRPEMYAGSRPWGPTFTAQLVHDVLLLGAQPLRIDNIGDWWLVAADRDWLRSAEGVVSTEPFFRIWPNPPGGGVNGFRFEVALTAFADAVMTAGPDGMIWVTGDPERHPLPSSAWLDPPNCGRGRAVAFRVIEV